MKAKRRAKASVKQRMQLLAAVVALGAVFAGVATVAFLQPKADADVPTIAAMAPVQVWSEDFENIAAAQATTASTAVKYTSRSTGVTYTSSTYWQNTTQCNGVILSHSTTTWASTLCPPGGSSTSTNTSADTWERSGVRRLADALGQFGEGKTGATVVNTSSDQLSSATTRANHAVTAWTTDGGGGANETVLQTEGTLPVTGLAGGGYYTASIDVSETSCGNANYSKLDLSFVVGDKTTKLTPTALSACDSSSGTTYYRSTGSTIESRAGRLTAANALYLSAADLRALKIKVTNQQGSSNGNDFAFDNLRLIEVTPSLDVHFVDSAATKGESTKLTFTVTNTSEKSAKTDWGFSTTLPAGLTLANNPNTTSTCTSSTGTALTVTAVKNKSVVTVSGADFAAGASQCTVTVDVVPAAASTYTIESSQSTLTGLIAPETTSIAADNPTTITIQKNLTARAVAGDQFVLSLRSGTSVLASATTTGTSTGVQAAKVDKVTVTPGQTYTIHEAQSSGTGLGYSSTYECVRSGTVIASGASTSGSITIPDEKGIDIVCTFTNTPRSTASLACDSSHYYGVTGGGVLAQFDAISGTTSTVATASGATSLNLLGINDDGTLAYAIDRSGSNGENVGAVWKWTPSTGFKKIANSAYGSNGNLGNTSFVAGVIDPLTNKYYFGKFYAGYFALFSYTESSNAFALVGYFSGNDLPVGNGDMAFDAAGNLYVLGSDSATTTSQVSILTVKRGDLLAASGGVITVSASSAVPLTGLESGDSFQSVNGLAFSSKGTAYLSNNNYAYEFDPTNWKRISGSPRIALTGTSDLASCASPSNITVQKNVVGRANSADQFTLTLANGATTTATATTSGSATGIQAAQIGPYPAPVGTTLSISEAMATGSVTPIGAYTTVYECWYDGRLISSGRATSGQVTMPSELSASVNCTFFNTSRPLSTVKVSKLVQDPTTGASTAKSGWTVGVTAGTATAVLPTGQAQQQTGSDGSASWTVLYGSASDSTSVVVSEVQQSGFQIVGLVCKTTVSGSTTSATVTTTSTTSNGVTTINGTMSAVKAGSALDCSFTNRPIAKLTLVEKTGFGSVAPGAWTLAATASGSALTGPTGKTGAAAVTGATVSPGVAYRLSEAGGSASYVQVGSWSCVDGDGKAVTVTADGDVTVAQGASVTCTVTNSTAGLTILKNVIDPQTGFEAKNWTITATPGTYAGGALPTQSKVGAEYSSATNGNAASTVEVRPGHSYTLTEALTDQTSKVAYQELRLEQLVNGSWVTVNSATITAPAAGQSAVYRFVNAPIPGVVLPLTGGMSTDAFMIAGAIILLLALSVAVVHGNRSRRRSTA